MGKKTIHGGLILKGGISSGTGDNLLTRDATTGEVGEISVTPLTSTLASANIFVGNASNVATAVAVTGDVTISNVGVTAIGSGVIVNADINGSAGIAVSKLAAMSASLAVATDASGFLTTVAGVSSTEVGYLANVTSDIQTQLNAKQATITGAASSVVTSNLTTNMAVVSNAGGKIEHHISTTSTEIGYLTGVTSAIQTQLNSKFAATLTSVAEGDIIYYNGTNWVNLARGTNGQTLRSTGSSIQWDTPTINGIPVAGTTGQVLAKQSATDYDADWETLVVASITDLTASAAELNILDGATLSTTELNYVDGVTSAIQTQLDSKLANSLPQNSIWYGNSSNVATALAGGTNGYVLTSVSGVPTWQPSSAGTPPGSDTQVVFNDGGSFGADNAFLWNKTTNTLTVGSLIGTTVSSSGDLTISSGGANVMTVNTTLLTVNSPTIVVATDAGTNTVLNALAVNRQSSSSPAAGIGVGIVFQTETAAGNTENGSIIESVTTDVTSTSEDFDLVFKTMAAGASAAERVRITSDGRLYGKSLHNNAGAVTGTTNQYIASGTYTPTGAGVDNIDSVTTSESQWSRVGNCVTVSGQVVVDPTSTSTFTRFTLTIPIASSLTANRMGGVAAKYGNGHATEMEVASITNGGSNTAEFRFFTLSSLGVGTIAFSYTYSYLIA